MFVSIVRSTRDARPPLGACPPPCADRRRRARVVHMIHVQPHVRKFETDDELMTRVDDERLQQIFLQKRLPLGVVSPSTGPGYHHDRGRAAPPNRRARHPPRRSRPDGDEKW